MLKTETAERIKRFVLVIMLVMSMILIWDTTADIYLPALRRVTSLLSFRAN